MSLIRSKLNNLLSENSLLKNELDKCERDQQNLVIYEKRFVAFFQISFCKQPKNQVEEIK